ncbi:hypothetical protein LEP1GSC128_3718 [Leptospira borgpetersenii str. 200801926]|uniref:Uncharacterized protein n=3 Tax=Leptospira borgpetersenii TaxID=174 RepID=M3HRD6_LEPBO|nr:hypothetical protein LEP1GSC128_3718 [Leptospira borgpetersenii str. 200801926]EKR00912.1 hypothetical protein LEP1GSC121_0202 [Leptospira borgpetersenii serovar Castellonis str. 200801910]EMG00621.1 hypothetical protein LEP1GSC123_2002 [Leptospira borgpetersenii str. 200701203]EMK12038.1 hypothetical protein LEP1GSC066_2281 [Leptospira sp. serovar Kenya str. Sh9]EMN17695.1 hypothetical protein LEP1GSC056_2654 [Leptospira borgpetersenii str. Brem 328]
MWELPHFITNLLNDCSQFIILEKTLNSKTTVGGVLPDL